MEYPFLHTLLIGSYLNLRQTKFTYPAKKIYSAERTKRTEYPIIRLWYIILTVFAEKFKKYTRPEVVVVVQ